MILEEEKKKKKNYFFWLHSPMPTGVNSEELSAFHIQVF